MHRTNTRSFIPCLTLVLVVGTMGTMVTMGTALAGDRIVERRTVEETLPLDRGTTYTVVVDNIFGAIRVEGHDRPRVELVAEETIRARSQTALERARKEVWLDVRVDGDEVLAVVDGPFRDRRRRDRGREWEGYTVAYDFTLRVPREANLELRTVNDGAIHVEDVHGRFRVHNVNGHVTLEGVTGPGRATTVNGPVRVRFDENPDGDCEFETVNGNLEMWFQPNLSADLFFKTFNGDALTDFDVTPLPSTPAQTELRDGRRVIRSGRWSGVRVDRGGAALRFETLNGDILIRNARR